MACRRSLYTWDRTLLDKADPVEKGTAPCQTRSRSVVITLIFDVRVSASAA